MVSKVEKRDVTAPQLTTKASALKEERSMIKPSQKKDSKKETPSKKIMTSKKASQQSEGQEVLESENTPTKN